MSVSLKIAFFAWLAPFLLPCVVLLVPISASAISSDKTPARPARVESFTSVSSTKRKYPRRSYPQAPDIIILGLNGHNITLKDERGKVVLVDFWASWCGPCRRMFPFLNSLLAKYQERGLEIIGISMDEGTTEDISALAKDLGLKYTIADGDRETAEAFGGLHGLPTSFLVDRQGRIRAKQFGYRSQIQLEREIVTLLGK